jgi:hypothetical protein
METLSMSDVIDIEIVVDTANVISSIPNPSKDVHNPTWIAHNFAFMIANQSYVRSGQASGNLNVSVDTGDQIRWRMTSLSGNTDYSAGLSDITHLSGATTTTRAEGILATPHVPEPGTTPGSIPLPAVYPTAEKQFDFFLQATTVTDGTENYSVHFQIYQYSGGSLILKGCYAWDPTLTVS